MKIVIIFDSFGPYHLARIKAAAKFMEVNALELSLNKNEYDWGENNLEDGIPHYKLNPRVKLEETINNILTKINPSVIAINGWSSKGAIAILHWCIKQKIPLVVMSESTKYDFKRFFWKEWIKRRIVYYFASGLVGGKLHENYLTELGMNKNHIYKGYDVVDNNYFSLKAKEVQSQKEYFRNKYQLPHNYFLASSRFIPKKNLFRLIQAFEDFKTKNKSNFHLVLLGNGMLFDKLNNRINKSPFINSIQIKGFIQYKELPIYYGLADIFIHASTTEQWGLVVNEAMASGLPVIVSERCGCSIELVKNGKNGFTFNPYRIDELVECMNKLTTVHNINEYGQYSEMVINNFTPEIFGQNLSQAVKTAKSKKIPKINLLDSLLFYLLKKIY